MSVFFINPFLFEAGADFESIATVTVGSGGAANIEFTSIPGTYQHLQIRMLDKTTTTTGIYHASQMRFNSDTGSNYASHSLYGTGASAGAVGYASDSRIYTSWLIDSATARASMFSASIIDILDYASTSKNTTARIFTGTEDNSNQIPVGIRSGLWMSTNAVTSVTLLPNSGNYAQHTTAALYGIKAP